MKIKYKRLAAYIIDYLLVSMVIGLFAASSLMRTSLMKYNDASERLQDYYSEMLDKVNDDDFEIDESHVRSLVYDVNYFGIPYNAIQVICIILYYVVFQFFNHGQTIGKKIMKIRVIDANDEELSLSNMLLRNVVLYNVIFIILNMLIVQFASVKTFTVVSLVLNGIQSAITITLLFMILFRKDEKGLHDLLGTSKVIEEK